MDAAAQERERKMYQVYNKTSTTYASGAPVVFNTTKFTDCRISTSNGTTFTLARPGRYQILFNGVGSSATAGSAFGVVLQQNESALPETQSTITSAAADDANALSFSTVIRVLPSCAAISNTVNLQVVTIAAGTLANANLVITKLG
jgi:hypothetical protein